MKLQYWTNLHSETNEEAVDVRALPLHKAPEKRGRMAMTYGDLIAAPSL